MLMRRFIGGALLGALLWVGPAAAVPCDQLLVGKAWRCAVVTPQGSLEVCAVFSAPDAGGLALSIDGGVDLPCTCKALGSIARPRFGESSEVACAGLSQAFVGKAGRTKLTKVFIRVTRGGSDAAAECVLDPTCDLSN